MNYQTQEPDEMLQALAHVFIEHYYKGEPSSAMVPWSDWLRERVSYIDEIPTMQLVNAIVRAQTPLRRRKWRDARRGDCHVV